MAKRNESNITVYETTNYSIFNVLEGNRTVTDEKINKVIESINEIGILYLPVLVNENMEVIDGQNRVAACEALKMPVYYIIQNGIGAKECQMANWGQTNWKQKDFVRFFAIKGNKHYQVLQSFIDRYSEVPLAIVALCISREPLCYGTGGSLAKKIKKGDIKTTDIGVERAEWELDYIMKLRQAAKKVGGDKRPFYTAVIYAYRNLDSEGRNRLEDVIRQHTYDIPPLTRPVDYLKHFDGYYNEGLSKSKRIKLAAMWELETI